MYVFYIRLIFYNLLHFRILKSTWKILSWAYLLLWIIVIFKCSGNHKTSIILRETPASEKLFFPYFSAYSPKSLWRMPAFTFQAFRECRGTAVTSMAFHLRVLAWGSDALLSLVICMESSRWWPKYLAPLRQWLQASQAQPFRPPGMSISTWTVPLSVPHSSVTMPFKQIWKSQALI